MRAQLPSGTVTFLFTDIEGSTRLLHALGPDAYAKALARHRHLLREAFAAHAGVEVDTQGDAFFVAFPTAEEAVAAALAAQSALSPGPISVRMGLHTGTPTRTTEGYVGIDVHRGARVAGLAHGGQVLVTETTRSLLRDEAVVSDLGWHRLKDFDGPARILQVGEGTFPPLRTPGAVDLPVPATPFLGRERELFEAVTIWVERRPRILTVAGTGGAGKTRFAIELARLLAEDADGGTVFVALAPVRDASLVVPALAERLGAAAGTPDAVAARVGERQTHVVLDNLEQLLPDVAGALSELVTAVPSLRLLTTSREPIRISGETELDLPPLGDADAFALFLERARAVRPGFEPTPAVVDLVSRLDRLPLALELAAARTKLLSPEALVERLGGRLDLFRGTRDADPRHATLRATIAWSYDLLEPGEQDAFARLAVFRGGCTLDAAEAVCEADLDTIASLLDKSLLRRRVDEGRDRYWMLETIGEFAAECLGDLPDEHAVRLRHAELMLELARSAHLSAETGVGVAEQRHDLVLAERENVRAALDWAADHDTPLGLDLLLALENFWTTHASAEGVARLERLVTASGGVPADLRGRILRMQGNDAALSGDAARAADLFAQSVAASRDAGDDVGATVALVREGLQLVYSGDADRGRTLLHESLARARSHDLAWLEAQAIGGLGDIDRMDGDLRAALDKARQSADLSERCGFRWWQAHQLHNVLELSRALGRVEEAEQAGRDALRLGARMEDRMLLLWTVAGLALVALDAGDSARAGRLWGAFADEYGSAPRPSDGLERFAAPLAAVEDPAFLVEVDGGRERGLDAAIEAILHDGAP